MKLTKNQVLILSGTLIFIFLLVYTPHLVNPFPIHIDEWTHITQAIKLKQGETSIGEGFGSVEIGFHVFLAFLSIFANIILIYKFLPAIWAIITALILFTITYKLTKNFFISIFTIIFFASLKSNVNITGLWFFIPLTFSIPFIFLYIYLFTIGIQKQNKKYIIYSLIIMLLLIPIHSISLLFAIPILFTYSLFHLNYIKKEWLFFSLFLIIPIAGIFFFSQLFNLTFTKAFLTLLVQLQFKHGWGVLELNNSPLELYSLIGYIFAIVGIISLLSNKQLRQKYLVYIIWSITVLTYILIFKLTGTSYLSPYQRNLYYFAISLPFLSAIGLYKTLRIIKNKIYKTADNPQKLYKTIKIILIILVIISAFISYFSIPKNIKLYKVIDNNSYETLQFLKTLPNQPNSKIMAPASISTAMFPISGHNPVGTIFFYGNREDVDLFFKNETTCKNKRELIQKYNITYVLSEKLINCSYTEIYQEKNITIYKI